MKFSVDADVFDKGLKIVSRAIPKRSSSPIYESVEITATEGNQLLLRGTDMEIELETWIPATVYEPGQVLVSAQRLTMLASKLPEGDVEITATNSRVSLKYGRNSGATLTLNIGEAPPKMNRGNSKTNVTVASEALANALQKVIPSVSVEAIRPVFKGIFFEGSQNKISLVATDSHRLALAYINSQESSDFSFILPGTTAKELLRLLPKGEEETIELSLDGNIITFTIKETVLSSRLIDGQFPNFRTVIPQKYDSVVAIEQEYAMDCIERCSLLEPEHLSLQVYNGKVHIKTESKVGVANEVIPLLEQSGNNDFVMVFNPRYLLDGIKSTGAEVIRLNFTGPSAPLVINTEGSQDLQLILPIRTDATASKSA